MKQQPSSTKTKAQPTKSVANEQPAITDISLMMSGDVFSDASHLRFISRESSDEFSFFQRETGRTIVLDEKYVKYLLQPADQHRSEVVVGREDKLWTLKQIDDAVDKGDLPKDVKLQPRVGDVRLKGIRSIWMDIYPLHVFKVCYSKQAKDMKKGEYDTKKQGQFDEVYAEIVAAKGKKSFTEVVEAAISRLQDNPVQRTLEPEMRELRGYKIQTVSNTGYFDVIDMDLDELDPSHGIRKVNINEIVWLIVGGLKYILE